MEGTSIKLDNSPLIDELMNSLRIFSLSISLNQELSKICKSSGKSIALISIKLEDSPLIDELMNSLRIFSLSISLNQELSKICKSIESVFIKLWSLSLFNSWLKEDERGLLTIGVYDELNDSLGKSGTVIFKLIFFLKYYEKLAEYLISIIPQVYFFKYNHE